MDSHNQQNSSSDSMHPHHSRVRIALAFASSVAATASLLGGLILATGPTPSQAQAVALVKVDVSLVANGYRASKLVGRSVVNEKNETIGKLDDIIIAHDNKLYSTLQVGGFLGLGSHLVAMPFDSLKIEDGGRKIELPGASREQLQQLTEFKYLGS